MFQKKLIFISSIILLMFIGMFSTIFGITNNKKVINYQYQEIIAQPISEQNDKPVWAPNIEFGPGYFNGIQIVNVFVTWTFDSSFIINNDDNASVEMKIYDDAEDIFSFGTVYENDNDGFFSKNTTIPEETRYILNIALNSDTENNNYTFKDNSEYIFSFALTVANKDYVYNTKSITSPSKSVINLTENAGTIEDATKNTVIINTSWEKDEQTSDNIFKIEENLTMWITDENESKLVDIVVDDKNGVSNSTTEVTGIHSETEFEDWSIVGTYFNGVKDVLIDPFPIDPFTTEDGITSTVTEITPTENSIFVTLKIINDAAPALLVKTEFYNNDTVLESNLSYAEHSIESFEEDGDRVWGTVIYEITNLDYNTEYNLNYKINNNFTRSVSKEDDSNLIFTLDKYSWTTTLNIVLLVIIIIELIVMTSILILLQKNKK